MYMVIRGDILTHPDEKEEEDTEKDDRKRRWRERKPVGIYRCVFMLGCISQFYFSASHPTPFFLSYTHRKSSVFHDVSSTNQEARGLLWLFFVWNATLPSKGVNPWHMLIWTAQLCYASELHFGQMRGAGWVKSETNFAHRFPECLYGISLCPILLNLYPFSHPMWSLFAIFFVSRPTVGGKVGQRQLLLACYDVCINTGWMHRVATISMSGKHLSAHYLMFPIPEQRPTPKMYTCGLWNRHRLHIHTIHVFSDIR